MYRLENNTLIFDEGLEQLPCSEELAEYKRVTEYIILPKSLKEINNNSFNDFIYLKSVEIPENVKHIYDSAFYNCIRLKQVIIRSKELQTIGRAAFYNCKILNDIVIPESVEYIGEWAFRNCKDLKAIALPDNITCIYEASFANCASLREVKIPQKVKKIYKGAFKDCASLAIAELPDNLMYLWDKAFYNCRQLKLIKLPLSLKEMGEYVFGCCKQLKVNRKDNEEYPYWVFNECEAFNFFANPIYENFKTLQNAGVKVQIAFRYLKEDKNYYQYLRKNNGKIINYIKNYKDIKLLETALDNNIFTNNGLENAIACLSDGEFPEAYITLVQYKDNNQKYKDDNASRFLL